MALGEVKDCQWTNRDRWEVVKVKEIIVEIEADGWYLTRQRGSHR